jgi:4-amino-4-deoxy-L-arabinose transferase-like glycosyltransferase
VRALHAARLGSALLSALSVAAAYLVFLALWPPQAGRADRRRLLAVGVAACWPQVAYLGGMVNNDNLLILLATVLLWLLLRALRFGWRREGLAVGVVLGLALLTKVNALLLIAPVGVAFLLRVVTLRGAAQRREATWLVAALLMTTAICGWWYVRNYALYGDALNLRAQYETWGARPVAGAENTLAVAHALRGLPDVYANWWARFGFTTSSQVVYSFFDGLSLVALVSLLWYAVRAFRGLDDDVRRQAALIGAFLGVLILGLLFYASRELTGNQPRYLFPGLAAWCALIGLGVTALLRSMRAVLLLMAVLVAVSTVSLLEFLPAYAPAPLPGQIEQPLQYTFGDPPVAVLIGTSGGTLRGRPGEIVRFSLYWRALRPAEGALITYLRSVDSEAVRRESYPATGHRQATEWQPGETWAEHYLVRIPAETEAQRVYPLVAGLYDRAAEQPLIARDAEGAVVTPIIAQAVINGEAVADDRIAFRFGGQIGLGTPQVRWTAEGAEMCLRWIALEAGRARYHVFVHALGVDGALIGQHDGPAGGVRYPSEAWAAGETVAECVAVRAARDQAARLMLGLYAPGDGARLPLYDTDGQRATDDALALPLSAAGQ